ncbi:LysR family transcriptional regulator [Ruegeria marisrubri]|uniref:LysR family transcriptional regulator n=1 Tax=Ruegeria marisrubri TaxID=1685379 RepID=UPI001CD1F288|nr:LysR family transcriptional regulator [Ruegeria marisrubri]MCA0907716.1 LysR family transcriptional regulator [Ruegeria marisrubri]
MNINAVDLNLLKAFDALYQERHVGRAGARIGLAQPSMSNALARLRALFDDPLFLRSPEGMLPTARADALAPQIRQALTLVAEMLHQPEFDPLRAEDHVTIAAPDLVVLTLAPALMRALECRAPRLKVSFQPLDKTRCVEQLENEEVELVIGHFGRLPARLHRRAVRSDEFVCIARQGHPAVGPDLSLEAFLTARHALMTLSRDFEGEVDRALKRLGHRREVMMSCAQFTALPHVIAASDLIATVPASLADAARKAGCEVFPLPIDMPTWQTEMVWTQKCQATPLGRFLVAEVEACARISRPS